MRSTRVGIILVRPSMRVSAVQRRGLGMYKKRYVCCAIICARYPYCLRFMTVAPAAARRPRTMPEGPPGWRPSTIAGSQAIERSSWLETVKRVHGEAPRARRGRGRRTPPTCSRPSRTRNRETVGLAPLLQRGSVQVVLHPLRLPYSTSTYICTTKYQITPCGGEN